jgi:hypothetical protein
MPRFALQQLEGSDTLIFSIIEGRILFKDQGV